MGTEGRKIGFPGHFYLIYEVSYVWWKMGNGVSQQQAVSIARKLTYSKAKYFFLIYKFITKYTKAGLIT